MLGTWRSGRAYLLNLPSPCPQDSRGAAKRTQLQPKAGRVVCETVRAVATSAKSAPRETRVETLPFVGVYVSRQFPGFLRWCEMEFVLFLKVIHFKWVSGIQVVWYGP